MATLQSLIKKYFPLEVIQKQEKVYLQSEYQTTANVRYRKWHENTEPVEMVETDKKYYFDRRKLRRFPPLKDVLLLILKISIPGLIIFTLFRLWTLRDFEYFLEGAVVFIVFIYLFIWWATSGLNRITVIDKNWIKTKSREGDSLVIEGEFHAPFSDNLHYFLKAPNAGMSENELFTSHKSSFRLTKTFIPSTTNFKFILRNHPPLPQDNGHLPLFQSST